MRDAVQAWHATGRQVDVWVEHGLIVRLVPTQERHPIFELHRPGRVSEEDIEAVRRALVPYTSGWSLVRLPVCLHFPPLGSSEPLEPVASECYVLRP